MFLFAFLVLGLMISSAALPAGYAASRYTLSVVVQDEANNKPIPDANVTIVGPETHSRLTEVNGTVTFSSILEGDYKIGATAPSYPTWIPRTIQVTKNVTVTILFGYTKAYFVFSPNHPTVNKDILFNASLSSSSANITRYSWDFGDNSLGAGMAANHSYAKVGDYLVTLTVNSTFGLTATYSQRVTLETQQQFFVFLWFPIIGGLLILPFILFFLWYFTRKNYIIIQACAPNTAKTHMKCTGDGDCDNCKVTAC